VRILVDVDGVLADHVAPALAIVNREQRMAFTRADVKEWAQQLGDTDIATEIKRVLADPDAVMGMPVIEGALEALNMLAEKHTIIIATSRPFGTSASTRNWLWVNRIPHSCFVCTNDKAALEGDLLIDDHLPFVAAFAATGRPAVLFTQPWNEDMPCVCRARGWQDVVRIVAELEP